VWQMSFGPQKLVKKSTTTVAPRRPRLAHKTRHPSERFDRRPTGACLSKPVPNKRELAANREREATLNGPSRLSARLPFTCRDWTLLAEDREEARRCRGEASRLRFAVQLCAVRRYGRFLDDHAGVSVVLQLWS
jgi:hypothetical protein